MCSISDGDSPFCTRNCAAVTFFFFPPAAPSAFSAFCCSFFCRRCQMIHSVGDKYLPWTIFSTSRGLEVLDLRIADGCFANACVKSFEVVGLVARGCRQQRGGGVEKVAPDAYRRTFVRLVKPTKVPLWRAELNFRTSKKMKIRCAQDALSCPASTSGVEGLEEWLASEVGSCGVDSSQVPR